MRPARKVTLSFMAVVGLSTVVLAVLGWQVNSNRHLARQGRQAHDALCVLKADLAQRITASREYLREHPSGAPGIPAKTIKASLANQQSTLQALHVLTCGTARDPPPES